MISSINSDFRNSLISPALYLRGINPAIGANFRRTIDGKRTQYSGRLAGAEQLPFAERFSGMGHHRK